MWSIQWKYTWCWASYFRQSPQTLRSLKNRRSIEIMWQNTSLNRYRKRQRIRKTINLRANGQRRNQSNKRHPPSCTHKQHAFFSTNNPTSQGIFRRIKRKTNFNANPYKTKLKRTRHSHPRRRSSIFRHPPPRLRIPRRAPIHNIIWRLSYRIRTRKPWKNVCFGWIGIYRVSGYKAAEKLREVNSGWEDIY